MHTFSGRRNRTVARRDVDHAVRAPGSKVLSDAVQSGALEGGEQVGLVLDAAIVAPLGQTVRDELLLAQPQRL